MLSKLPKPDIKATYSLPARPDVSLPAITFIYEGEVRGSDIKWNNSMGKITMHATGVKGPLLASCHIGQFTGNCGAKYIAHLNLNGPTVETKRLLMALIESWAYHKTNCGIIVGSDTTHPYKGQTVKNIEEVGMDYVCLPDVPNPNWNHKTALFWKDITKSTHTNHWAGGKEESLS